MGRIPSARRLPKKSRNRLRARAARTCHHGFLGVALLLALPCAAQMHERISVGVLGGGVATDSLDEFAQNSSESRRYTLGPLVEFHWRDRVGVASGFLYQRIGERGGTCVFTYCNLYRSRGHAWSVPLLLRWRFAGEATKPLVTGGYTYRRISRATREGESFRTGPVVSGEEVDYTIHRYTLQSPGENTHGRDRRWWHRVSHRPFSADAGSALYEVEPALLGGVRITRILHRL